MAVSNATGFAVTDVVFCKEIVFVRLEMGAICGGRMSRPPQLGQLKLGIQVDQIR